MKNQLIYLQLEKVLKLRGYSANTAAAYVSHIRQDLKLYSVSNIEERQLIK